MCGTIAGVTEFAWNPETYVQRMAQEVPDCPLLQEQLVATTLEPPYASYWTWGSAAG